MGSKQNLNYRDRGKCGEGAQPFPYITAALSQNDSGIGRATPLPEDALGG